MFDFLIVFFFLISNSLMIRAVCPEGWTRLGTHCYLFMDGLVDYDEASKECMSLGSEVVVIKSDFQNQLVSEFMFNTLDKQVNIWLGARKLINTAKYNQWVWSDFIEVKYFNWAPGQPNSNGEQYCMQMVRQHDVNYKWTAGTWNDIGCREKNAVLCQRKIEERQQAMANPKLKFLNDGKEDQDQTNIRLVIIIIVICSALISILVSTFGYLIINYFFKIKFKAETPLSPNFGFRLIRGQLQTFPSQPNSQF